MTKKTQKIMNQPASKAEIHIPRMSDLPFKASDTVEIKKFCKIIETEFIKSTDPRSFRNIGGRSRVKAWICDAVKNLLTYRDSAQEGGLMHSKFCHETADNGIVLKVGKCRRKFGEGLFFDRGMSLALALEHLRDQPWFTNEVRHDFLSFVLLRDRQVNIKEYCACSDAPAHATCSPMSRTVVKL